MAIARCVCVHVGYFIIPGFQFPPASEDMQGNMIARNSVVVAKVFDSQPEDAGVSSYL